MVWYPKELLSDKAFQILIIVEAMGVDLFQSHKKKSNSVKITIED